MGKTTADFYAHDYTKKWPGLTLQKAKEVGDEIGVDWSLVDLGEFIQGIKEEQEHSGILGGDATKVIEKFDYKASGMIAYEHLLERPDYYTKLEELEDEGEELYPDDEAKRNWVKNNNETFASYLSDLN
jgi:hypothetical protein